MREKIALLLQHHFIEHCKKEIGDFWQDCDLVYIEYESLDQLREIFASVKGQYDAFLTSGAVPMNAVKELDTSPYAIVGYFGGYLENTYRILLTQILKRGYADSSRIGLDYLDGKTSLQQVLTDDGLSELVKQFESNLVGLSEEELEIVENGVVEKYIKQCSEGGLDFVVTCFYSVVKALNAKGVECSYAYPSKNSLLETLHACLNGIRMEKIRRNIPAVLRISFEAAYRGNKKSSNQELEILNLKSALLEYFKSHLMDPVLRDDFGDIEVYLNKEQVINLTEHYKCFDLPRWMKERTPAECVYSIGVGEDLNKARFRAVQAGEYAGTCTAEEVSICMDESEIVHRLSSVEEINGPAFKISSSYVDQIANEVHLSSETIYRVIAAMQIDQSREFTAADLVRAQGFSLRIATRVLTALVSSGHGECIGQKRIGNKGRPQNLYRLDLEYEEGTVA